MPPLVHACGKVPRASLPSNVALSRRMTLPTDHRVLLLNNKELPPTRLPASEVGMIVDKGTDFPHSIDAALRTYGESMWFFREQPNAVTTRALNTYSGDDHREYVPDGLPCMHALIASIF